MLTRSKMRACARRSRALTGLIVWLVLLVALSQPSLAKPTGSFDVAASRAGVASAESTVEKQSVQSRQWMPAHVGDQLVPGDHLRTGPASAASLLLTDKTVMRLSEKTEIVIVNLASDEHGNLIRRFQLAVGRVWSDVTPHPNPIGSYEVKGPNAVAAVKGTAFEVEASASGAPTDVRVFDGRVQCGPAGSASFKPVEISEHSGNSLSITSGGELRRSTVLASARDHWQRWNMSERHNWKLWCKDQPRRLDLASASLRRFSSRAHHSSFFGSRSLRSGANKAHIGPGAGKRWGSRSRTGGRMHHRAGGRVHSRSWLGSHQGARGRSRTWSSHGKHR